ncbi:MAG: O-antigen ligase family protein [Planctomycetes bacterium]|nr:O-antigen ligase family protein [Planctomycetota bacterium]
MLDVPNIATPAPPGHRLRSLLSLMSLGLALVLLAATFFLMSPPTGASYPGAIPWREGSALKRITDLMSLGGSVATIRGVEIKDFAFHLATAVALVLLAARALVSGLLPPERRTAKRAWFVGQAFLAGWVLISLASSQWSGDADLSRGQAALYGLALAWAVALSWSLESRDLPRLLWGYVIIAAVAAALCVWYFYVRNPYHRPGFPIGNPGALASCMLPAILIAGALLIGSIRRPGQQGELANWRRVIAAVATLLPLCWCFGLAGSRAAWVGLVGGIAGVSFLRARRRIRWIVVIAVLATAALGAWYFSSGKQDITMARGATIRFRVYAWQYAAGLWSQRPISGTGAGSYPQLAGALSRWDRILDPAAFQAQEGLVEHAHNELFEIFAEIGLVGGVTFVAGYLATLVAASALLRTNLSPERRWLLLGLVAGVIALLVDAMFGVGLRLPGTPAVFYTLLGVLWVACRSVSKHRPEERGVTASWARSMVLRRYGLTAVSLVLALVAVWLSLRNWSGVCSEYAADVTYRAGRFEVASQHARVAGARLLDPVRKLIASKRVVDSEFARAYVAHARAVAALERHQADHPGSDEAGPAPLELQELAQLAADRCRIALQEAVNLSRHVPDFGRMSALEAQCAEMLADLFRRAGDMKEARAWHTRAFQVWYRQRSLRPFDLQTLLRLVEYATPYRAPTSEYIGLLRDALRNGFAPGEWHAALQKGRELPEFEQTLEAMRQSVGPYDPQSDLDPLILSLAPETYRLSAAWKAMRGDYEDAASDAREAARLYEPMRSRFPQLRSVALAEQAEYTFQARPDEPQRAVTLVREAIDALPTIQAQKYEAMVTPYRLLLARFLIAAENEREAARLIRAVLDCQPNNVQAWALIITSVAEQGDAESVRSALRDAEAAGVRGADLEVLRQVARQYMPDLLGEAEPE